ncbi:unnamed protein product [Orchesella dallaii]|uniref:Uncharacterized protein n=1 Tax=Orchesella dallaii TaxID=48710 RepID=A0ABP1S092_9HEXA
MPVTIHRLWIHGAHIIKYFTLPLGMLSEQAGESLNKMYKRHREHNSRKQSRIHTLTDVFNRCLDSSDPIINQYFLDRRVRKSKKLPLPSQAKLLLLAPEDHFSKKNTRSRGRFSRSRPG